MIKKGTHKPQNMHKMQAEYISTNLTLRQIAEKHGVSYQSVRDASHDEHWVSLRTAYRQQVRDGAVQLSLERDVNDLKLILSNSVKLLKIIQGVIDDPYGMRRYIGLETQKSGGDLSTELTERVFERVDTAMLKQLVESQKTIMDGIYKLYGIPTQAEAASQQNASERLELEREKFEAEQAKAEKDSTEEIVVKMDLPEGVTL